VLAQPVDHGVHVGPLAAEGVQEAEPALDHRGRAGQPVARQVGGDHPRVRGPSAVHPLDRAAGAVGLEQPGTHGRGDPRGVRDPVLVEPSDGGRRHRSPDRSADRRGVLAALEELRVTERLVVAAHAEPHGDLDADAGAVQ
jgi:hypothetical protein